MEFYCVRLGGFHFSHVQFWYLFNAGKGFDAEPSRFSQKKSRTDWAMPGVAEACSTRREE